MADVRLVDLEVIRRFSLAVRQDAVPAEELLEALDASRATVLAAMGTPPDGKAAAPKKAAAPRVRKAAPKSTPGPAKSTPGPAKSTPRPAKNAPGPKAAPRPKGPS